jgi:hypothetical protein
VTNFIPNLLPLFALGENPRAVWGRFDHSKPGVGLAEWSVILGATFLVVVVMIVSRWRAKRQKAEFLSDSVTQMFSELSRAHRLDRTNRRLLKKLAAAHGAKSAATLFVEPEYFDASKLPPALVASAQELHQLRHKLFE